MPSHPLDASFRHFLDEWIEEHRQDIIEGLSRLIQFPTVSGAQDPRERQVFVGEVRRVHTWLMRQSERWGLRSRSYQDRALVLEAGQGVEVIGVPVHIDVVPPGEGWRHGDPFSGAVDEDQIWGRGAQDNKGPLMAVLHAMAALVASGRPLRRRVKMIVGHGEEISQWQDVEFVREREGPPLWTIVPDSAFPLVTGEKGWLNAEITATWTADGPVRLESLASGERANIVPDRAEATLRFGAGHKQAGALQEQEIAAEAPAPPEVTWLLPDVCRIVTFGKRAHGSAPHRGHSALLDLLRLVGAALGDAPLGGLLREMEASCRDFSGERFGIKCDHEFLGPTTVSLGIMQAEASTADGSLRAVLNVRPTGRQPAAEAFEAIRRRVLAWSASGGITLAVRPIDRPFDAIQVDTAAMQECVTALEEAFRDVTGAEPVHLPMSGSTYAKVFPRAVGFGPCWAEQEPGLFHQVDERVPIASHLRNVRLYAEALGRLAL